MAEITAGMVKNLREKTDAPMMECKKALSEAAGDMGKAEEILRVKLGNKASKAASRVAAEGIVATYIAADGKRGALLEINCETDFVAKNADFLAFAGALAGLAADKNPADVAALSALDLKGTSVEETRKALIGKIGENVSIRRFVRVAAKGKLASYIHGGAKIGVLIDVVGGDEAMAKDLAMHIAASKPKALDASGVPADVIETERRIATEKAAEDAAKSGKPIPPDIMAKRVEGSVQKILREVTLLGQQFVKNDKQTVEQLLKASNAKVDSFSLYIVGEGMEKKKDDFAAEVMAAVNAANK
ncbi:MAG TPA: translation elongation factor Ts [Burkholderiales bacterium]|nr:translation elongation factor Ts [Burkholderiales bacterium]